MKDYETANRDNRDRQALLLQRAKLAYEVYTTAFPSSQMPAFAFEYLSNRQHEGWKKVVAALDTEPACSECGSAVKRVLCWRCQEEIG
jgi:hypothetical protein